MITDTSRLLSRCIKVELNRFPIFYKWSQLPKHACTSGSRNGTHDSDFLCSTSLYFIQCLHGLNYIHEYLANGRLHAVWKREAQIREASDNSGGVVCTGVE